MFFLRSTLIKKMLFFVTPKWRGYLLLYFIIPLLLLFLCLIATHICKICVLATHNGYENSFYWDWQYREINKYFSVFGTWMLFYTLTVFLSFYWGVYLSTMKMANTIYNPDDAKKKITNKLQLNKTVSTKKYSSFLGEYSEYEYECFVMFPPLFVVAPLVIVLTGGLFYIPHLIEFWNLIFFIPTTFMMSMLGAIINERCVCPRTLK
jgi:hypothetical protein